jgi:hypothetical protein
VRFLLCVVWCYFTLRWQDGLAHTKQLLLVFAYHFSGCFHTKKGEWSTRPPDGLDSLLGAPSAGCGDLCSPDSVDKSEGQIL